jgi:hypothetical protein
MKFTVEVDDFWIEEDELSSALSADIKRNVVQQISKSIEDKVEEQITKKVTARINEKIEPLIDQTLSDLIEIGVIEHNRVEISIVQHVKNLFMKHNGWASPDRKLEAIAKKFGQELKLQYNNAFASKIVSNMKEQGLLKDEVVQILLEGNNKGEKQ